MGKNQENKHWVTQAFVDAHPQWRSTQESLTVHQRDGWEYIGFQGLEIGRVKVDGKYILAESLYSYKKLGE